MAGILFHFFNECGFEKTPTEFQHYTPEFSKKALMTEHDFDVLGNLMICCKYYIYL